MIAFEHFEREYGETPREHLQAELGAEVASIVTGEGALTEFHVEVITSGIRLAIERRSRLLDVIEAEEEAIEDALSLLEEARTALESVESTAGAGEAAVAAEDPEQLEQLSARCDRFLHKRQRALDNRPQPRGREADREHWVGYLYRDLPVTYPLLDAVTAIRTAVNGQTTASLAR